MPAVSYLTIQEFLMRNGVEPAVADSVAMNELRHWDIGDLDSIFRHIDRKPRQFCPFQNVQDFVRRQESKKRAQRLGQANAENPVANYFLKTWPSVFKDQDVWISPPRDHMLRAAETRGALCVNAQGLWSVQHTGYSALSHVWIEGLQRDDEHGGVDHRRIRLIFQTLESRSVNVQWLWIDVLAIPGGGKKQLSSADTLLKISIINTLSDIYKNADSVIIFDALAWHLQSSDPVTLAVVLVCGLWASRLWTLQEVKMAKQALVITGGPQAVPWRAIRDRLDVLRETDRARYHRLWLWFAVNGKSDEVGITVTDMAMASYLRRTGNSVDYARAFFPIMGLAWKQHMTREQGMQELYHSQLRDSTRIIFMFGRARLTTSPAWAPCDLTGLEGIVNSPMQPEARGIRGRVLCSKVVECGANFRRLGVQAIRFSTESGTFQCKLSADERPTMLQELQKSVSEETLYLLLPHNADTTGTSEFARPALLVAKAQTRARDGFECAVFCCVMIVSAESLQPQTIEALIRDCDPRDEHLSGAIRYAWHVTETQEPPEQTASTPLHNAVRSGDIESLTSLLQRGAECDSLDGLGLSALHIAAKAGAAEMVHLLFAHGANVNLHSNATGKVTATMLAAQGNHAAIIAILAKAGADLEALNGYGETALMNAVLECHMQAARCLLVLGADVNCQQNSAQGSPLFITCSRTHPEQDRLAMAGLLLESGANVNGGDKSGASTPLHRAAEWSSDEVVSFLLAFGANVNARETRTEWTPLKYAIEKQRTAVVQMLIENGAACDSVFEGQWTPLHFAASSKDFDITRLLLSKSVPLNVQLTNGGWTAMHIAAKSDNWPVIQLLLEAGADPSLELSSGHKPIELATAVTKQKMTDVIAMGIVRSQFAKLGQFS